MAEVSFIGLGDMGFALADTAAKSGREIVVWNRTKDKALPLVDGNVTVASTLSRSACDWARRAGVSYLDGEIVAYVNQIGRDEFPLLLAGAKAAYDAAESLLKVYTPQIMYLGTDPVKSSALNLAVLSGTLGMTIGIMNGAALCEAAGISFQELVKDLPENTAYDADVLVESFRKIENDGLDSSDAPIEGWAQIADLMIEFQEETGYGTDVSAFIRQFYGKADKLGLGSHDVGSLIQVLRPNKT